MTHRDDLPSDAAGCFSDAPRFATDLDTVMLRDFVRVAIDEGQVAPLAAAPGRVVILLPDSIPACPPPTDLPQPPQSGRTDDPPEAGPRPFV